MYVTYIKSTPKVLLLNAVLSAAKRPLRRSFVHYNFLKPECTRGDQKVHGKKLPFLNRSIKRAGITALNTATHMQLIGNNMLDVSRLRALQLSSRQCYIEQTGQFNVAF